MLLCGCNDDFGGQSCQHFTLRHGRWEHNRVLLGIVPDNALILKNDVDRRKALQFLDGLVHLLRLDFRNRIRLIAVGHGHIEN